MVRSAFLIVTLALCPVAAIAQGTTTNCSTSGGWTTCDTRPRPDPLDGFNRGYEGAQSVTEAYTRARAASDAEHTRRVIDAISTAVLEHRCNDAKILALSISRMDLAEQALRLCTPQ